MRFAHKPFRTAENTFRIATEVSVHSPTVSESRTKSQKPRNILRLRIGATRPEFAGMLRRHGMADFGYESHVGDSELLAPDSEASTRIRKTLAADPVHFPEADAVPARRAPR